MSAVVMAVAAGFSAVSIAAAVVTGIRALHRGRGLDRAGAEHLWLLTVCWWGVAVASAVLAWDQWKRVSS